MVSISPFLCGPNGYEYPIVLVAGTCRRVQLGAETYYCAVILHVECESEDKPYLCIWNSDGLPHAVHSLPPDKGQGTSKIGITIEGNAVSVTGLNAKAPVFRITDRNNGKIQFKE